MANIRTDTDENNNPTNSYVLYTDAARVSRSIPIGNQSEENLALFRRVWDEALAHGRATRGRRKGKPVPRPQEKHLSVDDAIDSYFMVLDASKAAPGTKGNTKSQIRQLRKALGPQWNGWMTGYWQHLDGIEEPNTRNGRKRAANRLVEHHLDDIPDFTKTTKVNRPEKKYVSERRRPRSGLKKTYDHSEASALLIHVPTLSEFMQLHELTCAFMGMSPQDARNFLRGITPLGAETTRHDWIAGTYFGRRQKTPTYYEDVPIPRDLQECLRPHVKRGKLVLPFDHGMHAEEYRKGHRELEEAAGVKRILRRNLNAWRHHFSTTLEVDLRVPRVVVKALMAQKTSKGERQDIIDTYQHAWPDLLREASHKFEDFMTSLTESAGQEAA